MTLLRAKYRIRYYYKEFMYFFNVCPDCFSTVNVSRTGSRFCTSCSKRG